MRKLIALLLVSILLIFVSSCTQNGEKQDESKKQNITVDSVSCNDFSISDGIVVFYTRMFVTNNTKIDKYFRIKGDFETEYKVKMINEQVLRGYDTKTGYTVFYLPAESNTLFDVSFSTSAYKTETKPDRLPPEILIEEVAQSEVNTSEVVTNIATKSDSTIIIPE